MRFTLHVAGSTLLLSAVLAGCLNEGGGLGVDGPGAAPSLVGVVDDAGTVLRLAQVTALGGDGEVLRTFSTDANGTFLPTNLPAGTRTLLIGAPGRAAWSGAPDELPPLVKLAARTTPLDRNDAIPLLTFLAPKLLGGAILLDQPATCELWNCGGSEPSVEVAGDGSIYVTGVCCIGVSPPIWVSRDHGQTFTQLRADPVRDNFGIEGDFAIDDAGNLYFIDTSLANGLLASWDKTGRHRWTTPLGPFLPLVDRPWIRAGSENHVYFAYNAGDTTRFHISVDGGRNWDLGKEFPEGGGNLGQGPERTHLWLVAGASVWESKDEGKTWGAPETLKRPSSEGTRFTFPAQAPVVDEAGHVWVAYEWRLTDPDDLVGGLIDPKDDVPYHIYVNRRDSDGTWHGPFQVSPPLGTHYLSWSAAARNGVLAVAWYGTFDDAKGPNAVSSTAQWYLFAAVATDGATDAPHFQVAIADPEPVHVGPMDRKLLDFLQVDVGPDGDVHIAYAQDHDGRPDEVTQWVGSTTGLRLQPARYPNGPAA